MQEQPSYPQPPQQSYAQPAPAQEPYGAPAPPNTPYGQQSYGPPMPAQPPYGCPPMPPRRRRGAYDLPVLATFLTILQYLAYGIVLGLAVILPLVLTGAAASQDVLVAASLVPTLVAAMAMAVVYEGRNRRRRSFDGMLVWASKGLLMTAPAIAFAASNMAEGLAETGPPVTPLPVAIALAFIPGFAEEVVFRGIPCANWMRVRDGGCGVLPCVLVTSLAFGLMHGTNVLAGASVSSTLFQLVYATALGILLSAAFLRTGSIWPCIIVHTLIDASAFAFTDLASAAVIAEELSIDGYFVAAAAATVALAAIGFFLVRPSKHPEIGELWSRKWSKGPHQG